MPEMLRISDVGPAGSLSFDLRDLLPLIEPEGRNLKWVIHDLHVRGDYPRELHIGDLLARITESPRGITVGWDTLLRIASGTDQTVDGLIVGCNDPSQLPGREQGADVLSPSEIVLEAFDTTYWTIYARSESVLDRVRKNFQRLEACPPDEWMLQDCVEKPVWPGEAGS